MSSRYSTHEDCLRDSLDNASQPASVLTEESTSVVASLIKRFRDGKPAPPEERRRPVTKEDMWWIEPNSPNSPRPTANTERKQGGKGNGHAAEQEQDVDRSQTSEGSSSSRNKMFSTLRRSIERDPARQGMVAAIGNSMNSIDDLMNTLNGTGSTYNNSNSLADEDESGSLSRTMEKGKGGGKKIIDNHMRYSSEQEHMQSQSFDNDTQSNGSSPRYENERGERNRNREVDFSQDSYSGYSGYSSQNHNHNHNQSQNLNLSMSASMASMGSVDSDAINDLDTYASELLERCDMLVTEYNDNYVNYVGQGRSDRGDRGYRATYAQNQNNNANHGNNKLRPTISTSSSADISTGIGSKLKGRGQISDRGSGIDRDRDRHCRDGGVPSSGVAVGEAAALRDIRSRKSEDSLSESSPLSPSPPSPSAGPYIGPLSHSPSPLSPFAANNDRNKNDNNHNHKHNHKHQRIKTEYGKEEEEQERERSKDSLPKAIESIESNAKTSHYNYNHNHLADSAATGATGATGGESSIFPLYLSSSEEGRGEGMGEFTDTDTDNDTFRLLHHSGVKHKGGAGGGGRSGDRKKPLNHITDLRREKKGELNMNMNVRDSSSSFTLETVGDEVRVSVDVGLDNSLSRSGLLSTHSVHSSLPAFPGFQALPCPSALSGKKGKERKEQMVARSRSMSISIEKEKEKEKEGSAGRAGLTLTAADVRPYMQDAVVRRLWEALLDVRVRMKPLQQ